MNRFKKFIAAVFVAVGILAVAASPASAHMSYASHHGSDGQYEVTTWKYSYHDCTYTKLHPGPGQWRYGCGHHHAYHHWGRYTGYSLHGYCFVRIIIDKYGYQHYDGIAWGSPPACWGD